MRKSVLSKGYTGKYIKYAVGEIILVVIGILIALQINNWNEERKGNAELNQYLFSLRDNLSSDIKILDSLIERRTITVANCKKEQLNFLNKTYDFYDTRFALYSYLDFYFKPNTSAYDALKSSPYLGKINGSDLNDLIIEYYAKTNQIAESEKSYNEYVEDLEAKLAYDQDRTLMLAFIWMDPDELGATKTTEEEIQKVFKELHETVAFRNIVSHGVSQEKNIIVPYRQARQIGMEIINQIGAQSDYGVK
ncbi:MAG: DUF6090 family protein, partial [Flavobacteriaceae bacterium]|nr:DUF6090 family protein [Flavobacteriaceae bacterium]